MWCVGRGPGPRRGHLHQVRMLPRGPRERRDATAVKLLAVPGTYAGTLPGSIDADSAPCRNLISYRLSEHEIHGARAICGPK
jgi:hypothetical protein